MVFKYLFLPWLHVIPPFQPNQLTTTLKGGFFKCYKCLEFVFDKMHLFIGFCSHCTGWPQKNALLAHLKQWLFEWFLTFFNWLSHGRFWIKKGPFREGLTRKKNKVWNFTLGGGGGDQDKIGSFSHFFYFFSSGQN